MEAPEVHSFEETPISSDPFTAYVPVADESSLWPMGSSDLPSIDVEIVGGRNVGEPGPASGWLVVEGVHEKGGGIEARLQGLGGGHAFLAADRSAGEFLTEGTYVMASDQLLGLGGRTGWKFRPVEVLFQPDTAIEPWENEIWLPVTRIHRPNHPGCISTYTAEDANTKSYSAGFTFGGVLSVGGTVSFKVAFKRRYSAEMTCKQVAVRSGLRVEFGTTLIDGTPVAYGTRIAVVKPSVPGNAYEDVPPDLDSCGWPESKIGVVPEDDRWDLSRSTGGKDDGTGDEQTIEREVTGFASVAIPIPGHVPVMVSLGFTRTCTHTTVIATDLTPGARYVAYRPRADNPLERCWTVV